MMDIFSYHMLTSISDHLEERGKNKQIIFFSRSDRSKEVHQPEKDQNANEKTHAHGHVNIGVFLPQRWRVKELTAFLF